MLLIVGRIALLAAATDHFILNFIARLVRSHALPSYSSSQCTGLFFRWSITTIEIQLKHIQDKICVERQQHHSYFGFIEVFSCFYDRG